MRKVAADATGWEAAEAHLLDRVLAGIAVREWPGARPVRVRRFLLARASSWWLEELRVELDDGRTGRVIFKDLGREAPGSRAHRTKPARLQDPAREPWVYCRVLPPLGATTPRMLASISDPPAGRYWLFLEPVDGVPLNEVGWGEPWLEAARWLARFHARTGSAPQVGSPLIEHTARLHRGWLRRALALAREGARCGEAARASTASTRLQGLHEIAEAHSRAAAAVEHMPQSVVHGEFYPSNVLVERGRRSLVRPLDWEMAGVGPSLLDLAALAAGRLPAGQRHALALAYHREAALAGIPLPPLETFLVHFAACSLLLAVQWLGWGRDWQPPREHANDWLTEARARARELP